MLRSSVQGRRWEKDERLALNMLPGFRVLTSTTNFGDVKRDMLTHQREWNRLCRAPAS